MALPITRISTCPPANDLGQLVSGSLNEDVAEGLFAHIEECSECQRIMDDLAKGADGMIAVARNDADSPDQPRLSGLIRKAQKIGTNVVDDAPIVRETVSVDGFVSGLRRCGLFPEDEVDALLNDISGSDSSSMAKQLVGRKKLTPFQARVLLKGRWKGLVLGNYIILEKLGQGGMGSVFKAKHRRLGRIVCVKVINSAGRKSPRMLERFRNEARTVAALSHPNFVVAHDADEAEGVPFLVMEYVEGQDLARDVASTGPLTVEYALRIVHQAAQALQYAHDQGVTHRDIKPHNLLVAEGSDSDELQVKILDLGLARFDSLLGENMDASTHAAMTNTGVIMGTVDYMSPEQALRSRDADNRSDIYSLGCTLHFLITGRPVFDGDTLMARLIAHREAEIPSVEKTCPGTPPGLDAVFRRMLAKNPEHRYQTMDEVAADLDAILHGRTPIADVGNDVPQQPTVMEKHRSKRRQPAYGAWLAVCSLILAVVGGMWAVVTHQSTDTQPNTGLAIQAADPSENANDSVDGDDGTSDSDADTVDFGNVAMALTRTFHDGPQLQDGGPPRAVAILARKFNHKEFDALQSACEKYHVELAIAGPQEESLTAVDDISYTLSPTVVLDNLKVDDYDMAFVVGGSIGDFEPLYENGMLETFSVSSGGLGRVIGATSQQACKVFDRIDLGIDCRRTRMNGVYYGRVAGTGGAVVYATENGAIDELVNRAIQMRIATLTARRTNSLDEDSLAGFGNGRALIVLPTKEFRSSDYDYVTSVLADAGVEVEVAASDFVEAHAKDSKRKVAVTMSLKEFPNLSKVRFSNLFDYVFVIGGNSDELKKRSESDLRDILQQAVISGSVVAGLSADTKEILNLSPAIKTAKLHQHKSFAIGTVENSGAVATIDALRSRDQMLQLFRRIQELRQEALKADWSNQL